MTVIELIIHPKEISRGLVYRKNKKNSNKKFVGYSALKKQQKTYLDKFEKWASKKEYNKIHQDHYDWWMFPIPLDSSFGYNYTCYEGDVEELKKDEEYIKNYKRGVELLAESWGWDIKQSKPIDNPVKHQKYTGWDVRLRKIGQSLLLFEEMEYHASMNKFVEYLFEKGWKLDIAPSEKRGLWPFAIPKK